MLDVFLVEAFEHTLEERGQSPGFQNLFEIFEKT